MTDRRRDPLSVELALPMAAGDTSDDTETRWDERVRQGDRVALERFAREQAPRVLHLLYRILGPRDDAHDLVQTVFVELMRALPRFRGESRLSTFVGGITVRVARRALRPSAFTRHRATLLEEPQSPAPSLETELTARERVRRVHAALARIKPKKRIAFALWAFEGMSPQEIAELTDASVAAVRSRIFYAQKELRAMAQRDPWLADLVGDDDE